MRVILKYFIAYQRTVIDAAIYGRLLIIHQAVHSTLSTRIGCSGRITPSAANLEESIHRLIHYGIDSSAGL